MIDQVISDIDKEILEQLCNDWTPQEITEIVNRSYDNIVYRLKLLQLKFDVETNVGLVCKLVKLELLEVK